MLHETIDNDDFERNTALKCWNNIVTIRNNVATMLLCCTKNRSQSEEPSVVLTLEDGYEIFNFAVE